MSSKINCIIIPCYSAVGVSLITSKKVENYIKNLFLLYSDVKNIFVMKIFLLSFNSFSVSGS